MSEGVDDNMVSMQVVGLGEDPMLISVSCMSKQIALCQIPCYSELSTKQRLREAPKFSTIMIGMQSLWTTDSGQIALIFKELL